MTGHAKKTRGFSSFASIVVCLMVLTPSNSFAQETGSRAPIATDGERIILGEPWIARLFKDAAYVFVRDGGAWREEAKLSYDGFRSSYGSAVAIRGNRLAITVEEQERTLIFDRVGESWIKMSEIASDDQDLHDRWDKFLQWVDDNTLVSSAVLGDSGVVYVRHWNGTTWDETVLTSSDEPTFWFGWHFSATDSVIVVSEPGPAEGGAYVFGLTQAGWVQEAKLVPADAIRLAGARRVTISGTTVMMPYVPTRGGAWDLAIFEHDDSKGIWDEIQTLPDLSQLVVLDGKWAASRADDGSNIKLLERDPTGVWEESATVTASRRIEDLSLSGNLLVAGLQGRLFNGIPNEADVFALDTLTGEWAFDVTLSGRLPPEPITGSRLECVNGLAGPFPCDRVDLLAFLPTEAIGGLSKFANGAQVFYRLFNVWGWTHKDTGREFALVAREDATVFVEVTGADQGVAPILVGELPAVPECAGCTRRHRYSDVRVFEHYAFVSGYEDSHEIKVFDLNRLLDPESDAGPACDTEEDDRTNRPRCFAEDAAFLDQTGEPVISGAFNLSIAQETGFAYAIGAQRFVSTTACEGTNSKDLFIIDVRDPLHPEAAGCYEDPAVEAFNAQCVVYRGPDADYSDKEICFVSAKTALQIVDVTDKLNPSLIASTAHADVGFINHGSLSSDHGRFLMADDQDELFVPSINKTRTIIWDVSDLDNPVELSSYFGRTAATDYQLYVDEGLAFIGNSYAGITVLDIDSDPSIPVELGWFDTLPATDEPGHNGAWSVYPYLPSGNVLVSSREQGLFVLRPTAAPVATVSDSVPEDFILHQNYPNPFNPTTEITFSLPLSGIIRINVYDMLGREMSQLINQHLPAGHHTVTWEAGNLPSGVYLYRLSSPHGTSSRVATLLR